MTYKSATARAYYRIPSKKREKNKNVNVNKNTIYQKDKNVNDLLANFAEFLTVHFSTVDLERDCGK